MRLNVLPPLNIGPPFFFPSLTSEPLRIRLGESNIFRVPQILDPDPEDINPTIKFTCAFQLQGLVSYDSYLHMLLYSIPYVKPPLVTLEKKYPLRFTLNDHNLEGEKSATYTLYVQIFDPI